MFAPIYSRIKSSVAVYSIFCMAKFFSNKL